MSWIWGHWETFLRHGRSTATAKPPSRAGPEGRGRPAFACPQPGCYTSPHAETLSRRAPGGGCRPAARSGTTPYPAAGRPAIRLYTAFTDRPKHLDPAQSYTERTKSPSPPRSTSRRCSTTTSSGPTLIPTTVEGARAPLLRRPGPELPADAPVEAVAESVYELRLRPRHPLSAASRLRRRCGGRPVTWAGRRRRAPVPSADFPRPGAAS